MLVGSSMMDLGDAASCEVSSEDTESIDTAEIGTQRNVLLGKYYGPLKIGYNVCHLLLLFVTLHISEQSRPLSDEQESDGAMSNGRRRNSIARILR
jgi:hypothetical protein